MAVEVVVRKLGNSIGVLFSRDFVREKNLVPNEKVSIDVFKKTDLRDVFGTLKTNKTAQELKDLARKGWD